MDPVTKRLIKTIFVVTLFYLLVYAVIIGIGMIARMIMLGHMKNSWRRAQEEQYMSQEAEAFLVFGLTPEASWDEVSKRYKELVRRYHPDRGGDEETMKRVTAVYAVLRRYYGK